MAPTPAVQSSGKEYAAPQLPHHKVKVKKLGQRACNEKDAKGKLCGGHLKRWYYASDVKEQACGCLSGACGQHDEVYLFQHCNRRYLAKPAELGGHNAAGQ